ncbi:MAG: hypothetical protein E7409_04635 [Ruminococcaceae bacterium]|nr:hypothetical protein [Oscillospiraceae bacterium]
MKRTLIFLMVALLVLSSGCGKKKQANDQPVSSQSQTENGAVEQKKEQPASKPEQAEKKQPASAPEAGSNQAPVVNSMEELESMINEFNSAEEGDRKEELRQQLEKILEQAGVGPQ